MIILGTNSIKGGFEVSNSLRVNDGDSQYLSITPGSAGNTKLWTWSCWFKKCPTGADLGLFGQYIDANNYFRIKFRDDDRLQVDQYTSGSHAASAGFNFILTQQLRDVSAWYHLVVAYDSAQGTDSNRVKIYINGTRVTAFNTETYPNQNVVTTLPVDGTPIELGRTTDSQFFDGYLAETVLIDGSALTPTSFGEFDTDSPTIWKPKPVAGLTFGTNGFYLQTKQSGTSQNSSGLGADTSGNDNHFAVNNLTALAQATDTCTNNFCTLNFLSGNEMNFQNGNLVVAQASDDGGAARSDDNARGTVGVNVGKWYWEAKLTGATAPCVVGICFDRLGMGDDLSGSTGVYAIQNASGTYAYRRENGTTSETAGFPNPVANNIMNVAFDADNAKLYLGINGTYYNKAGSTGNPATASNPTYSSIDTSFFWLPWIESRGDNQQALMNFGGGTSYSISSGNTDGEGFGNFEYAVPSGYFALCTKNLAEYG